MTAGILLARDEDGKVQVLGTPDTNYEELRRTFKELERDPKNGGHAVVELWNSNRGRVKICKLAPKLRRAERAKLRAKEREEAERAAAAAEADRLDAEAKEAAARAKAAREAARPTTKKKAAAKEPSTD